MSGAVVYAKDLRRMQSFYAACFGMEMADEAGDYCMLESESRRLSLVAVPEHAAATIGVSVPPTRRERSPIKLVFTVQSIEGMRDVVAGLGGLIDPTATQWEFRGSIHCDGVDPEGNVIQLLEPIAPTISSTDR